MRCAKQDIKNVIFLIHNVTRLPLHVGLGFPRLVVPYLTFSVHDKNR